MNLNSEKSYAFWNKDIPKRNYKLQRDIIKNTLSMLAV
jgi:hypothetical protein